MEKFICKECGFRFESEQKKCPYCGKKEVEKEKNAAEIIEEVEKIMK